MSKLIAIVMVAAALKGCPTPPMTISDFCKTIDTIGYEKLLKSFSDEELKALKLDRKRALLALRKSYDKNCTAPSRANGNA